MKKLVLAVLLAAPVAGAQSVYFEDSFACSNETGFGIPPGLYGWQATFPADAWNTSLNGGVSPNRDQNAGSFGPPVDDYESFLLTGHPAWNDVTVEATISNTDDDAMGLVVRYGGPGSYYACYATRHQAPACAGGSEAVGTRVALIRVDASQACANDYRVTTVTSFQYQLGVAYRFRLSVRGGELACSIDSDGDGTAGSDGDLTLTYSDPQPLGPGLAGLYNFDNGEPGGGVIYDDVLIVGYDPDADGDGLPDAVEIAIGTDPNDPDTDNDRISDRDEALMPAFPPDTDGDAGTDALDRDSDGDGIPDKIEAGDRNPLTPPRDSDCDGIPDYRDTDSDNDGTPDGADTCPEVDGPQTDSDGDGVGDVCDSAPNNPGVCADRDADGCDDCLLGAWNPDADGPDADGDGDCDGATDFIDTNGDGLDDRLRAGGSGIACAGAASPAWIGLLTCVWRWRKLRDRRRHRPGT